MRKKKKKPEDRYEITHPAGLGSIGEWCGAGCALWQSRQYCWEGGQTERKKKKDCFVDVVDGVARFFAVQGNGWDMVMSFPDGSLVYPTSVFWRIQGVRAVRPSLFMPQLHSHRPIKKRCSPDYDSRQPWTSCPSRNAPVSDWQRCNFWDPLQQPFVE